MGLTEKITQKITSTLPDAKIEIIDFSNEHKDHHASGAHIAITITSSAFKNKSLVEQHQTIYKILNEEIKNQIIHALRIRTRIPENERRNKK